MSKKLLSISIASYNAEKTLKKAVDSCIVDDKEILEKIEIIIVNDGSKDNTYQLAEELKNMYFNIKVINKENGGYGSTVNAAILVAEGKYFKLLDSDDWYNTSDLLKLLYELDKIDSDMVVTNYTEVRDEGNTLISYTDEQQHYDNLDDISEHFSMHAVMYKTEILRNNNIKLHEGILYTDTEFVAYPLMFVNTITFFPYNVYQYSLYGEGQSVSINSRINHINDAEIIVQNLQNYIEMFGKNVRVKDVYWNKLADAVKFYINGLLLANDKDSKRKLKSFDLNLKEKYNYVYHESSNKIISFLRYTYYLGYSLCGVALRKTIK